MSGHSKWSTIKRQKAVTDSRRSAVFTKLGRCITVAAREGGGDPEMNFKLRLAIDKAKAANVPNDNIERAIKTGTGENRGQQMREAVYEGFGPGQVAIIVSTLSDNPNRTSAEIRQTFQRHGGTLGTPNSVSWMFATHGVHRLDSSKLPPNKEDLLLSGIDHGVTDTREDEHELLLFSDVDQLPAIRTWLEHIGLQPLSSGAELLPITPAHPSEAERDQLHRLFEELDDHLDVTTITSNES